MRRVSFVSSALLLFLMLAPASAEAPQPYKAVTVKLPPFLNDPSLDAFRKDVAAVAKRRDRNALAGMVVAKGFFWDRDDGKGADDSKSGIDNLAAAFELNASDGAGWDALADQRDQVRSQRMGFPGCARRRSALGAEGRRAGGREARPRPGARERR
jgi:hypothetical protein